SGDRGQAVPAGPARHRGGAPVGQFLQRQERDPGLQVARVPHVRVEARGLGPNRRASSEGVVRSKPISSAISAPALTRRSVVSPIRVTLPPYLLQVISYAHCASA